MGGGVQKRRLYSGSVPGSPTGLWGGWGRGRSEKNTYDVLNREDLEGERNSTKKSSQQQKFELRVLPKSEQGGIRTLPHVSMIRLSVKGKNFHPRGKEFLVTRNQRESR